MISPQGNKNYFKRKKDVCQCFFFTDMKGESPFRFCSLFPSPATSTHDDTNMQSDTTSFAEIYVHVKKKCEYIINLLQLLLSYVKELVI